VRLILDTNVVVSGVLWRGVPYRLLTAAEAHGQRLLTGHWVIDELRRVLTKPGLRRLAIRSERDIDGIVTAYRNACEWVPSPEFVPRVVRDPDDDHVVALALAGRADLLVSGDSDLLALRQHRGVPIVNPTQALAIIVESTA
jgi:uncharacterized protein